MNIFVIKFYENAFGMYNMFVEIMKIQSYGK